MPPHPLYAPRPSAAVAVAAVAAVAVAAAAAGGGKGPTRAWESVRGAGGWSGAELDVHAEAVLEQY